jgi:hypothetical protein
MNKSKKKKKTNHPFSIVCDPEVFCRVTVHFRLTMAVERRMRKKKRIIKSRTPSFPNKSKEQNLFTPGFIKSFIREFRENKPGLKIRIFCKIRV